MTAARNFEDPAYQRIAAEWAETIDDGQLGDGDRLPTRPELEQRYGVSRQVIRDALALLHQEGYIRSVPGPHGGTYVVRPVVLDLPMYVLEADDRALDAFIATVADQGHAGHQVIRIETASPDPGVAATLELKSDQLVTIRRRTRYVDDTPYAIADSYYSRDLVAGTPIAEPADIRTGARHVLKDLGLAMISHRDVISARRPHRSEIQALGVAPGLSMITHDRTSYTADQIPVRHMRTVLPSDRWRITYEVSS